MASICARFASRNERRRSATLGHRVQRLVRYGTASIGVLQRIRALLAVLIADPSRALGFYQHVRKQGLRETVARILRVVSKHEISQYREWVDLYDTISPQEAKEIRRFLAKLPIEPKFSVLVPVYQTPLKALIEMTASVKAQIYDNWELCIADDASKQPHIREFLEAEARAEPRIKLVFREENGNISAASNSALALATGDFVALLDHDDVLAPHALAIMAEAINRHPGADILYSDEDKLDADGHRYGAYFKPDWNPELLYGQNFISHLGVYRTSLVRGLGGFRVGFEGSQDYDMALRATAATASEIVHVPHILYHWRVYPGAGTFTSTQMARAVDTARRAIKEQLAGKNIEGSVGDAGYNYHRVFRANPAVWPRVSVIVSVRQHPETLSDCMEGLLEKTDYPSIEIVVVEAGEEPRANLAIDSLKEGRVQLVRGSSPAVFTKTINETVHRASGEIVLFLDSGMSVIEPGWLKEMVLLARQRDIGAVGAQLRAPDGKTWLGGMVLGLDQIAGPVHGLSANSPAYYGRLLLTQDVSCVCGACMAVSRAAFESVGGFDESELAPSFTDVDFCIRLRRAGYRVVWTPHARLHHRTEDRSTGTDDKRQEKRQEEIAHMRKRWGPILERDPFWNPNLSLASNYPLISVPPRATRPWQEAAAREEYWYLRA